MSDSVWSDDGGRRIDWGRTADDYARWRPGYPASFFARLRALGVGRPGQRVLDLATGTGALALPLAAAGCTVTGVDLAAEQVAAAERLARERGLSAAWLVADAHATGLPDAAFDVVTASQCFGYFDPAAIWPELRRLLAPGGLVVVCHLFWLPLRDEVARQSEELVLQFVPEWSGAGWDGAVPEAPRGMPSGWEVVERVVHDEAIPVTRDSWLGRFRACRATGASMGADELARFDAAHRELLERIAPERFEVLHRMDATLLRPR